MIRVGILLGHRAQAMIGDPSMSGYHPTVNLASQDTSRQLEVNQASQDTTLRLGALIRGRSLHGHILHGLRLHGQWIG